MSPFEIFRRNLKPMMVFLTALALFAFVVLPAMDTYLRRGGGGGGNDPTIAVFDGVPVTQSRVDYLTRNHHSMVRFLRELATETIRRGGAPRTPGFVYDTQSKQIRQLGIDERPSPLSTVRTLQFATEANKAGFQLDDTAIKSWLNSFTDGTMSDSEVIGMLMNSTRNQMGQFHLYEQLRNQLLAELYQRGSLAAVVDGQFPIMTPAEQWADFLKINQQATVNAYGVLVNDYIDQTDKSPPESEVQAVYKEGIERYFNENSPEPGFRKRDSASFEYLVADREAFIQREIETISEDTLKAEYQRRLKGGDFQLPLESEAEKTEAEKTEAEKTEAGKSDAEKSDAAEGDDSEAEQEKMKKPESATDAAAKPADPAETNSEPATADQEAAQHREQVQQIIEEIEAVRLEFEKAPSPDADDQSRRERSGAVRLVVFQQDSAAEADDKKAQQKPEVEPATAGEAAEKADAAKGDEPKADAAKADEPKADEPKADAPEADPKADDPKAAEEAAKDATSAANPDEKQPAPASDDPSATPPADETEQSTEPDEPKVESFEDVRDEIARSLASAPAAKKMDAAVVDVTSVMRRYFNEKAIHDSNVMIGKAGKPPVKPDLQALADKLGLKREAIGPHDVVSLASEPISQSSEMGAQMGQRGPSFAAMMFGVESEQSFIPKQQLYSPLRTQDQMSGRVYVTWKTEEKEAYVPQLDEVRADVIKYIRTREARQLARAAADKIAEQVNAGKTLAEVVPEDKKANLKEGLGPFSWMQSFGFQGAFLGNVPELDSVGEEFMEAVFKTEKGKAVVAANMAQRAFYVVKATDLQPHIDDLKQIFTQPQERMMALPLGSNDVRALLQGFYKSVDDRTGFTFTEDE